MYARNWTKNDSQSSESPEKIGRDADPGLGMTFCLLVDRERSLRMFDSSCSLVSSVLKYSIGAEEAVKVVGGSTEHERDLARARLGVPMGTEVLSGCASTCKCSKLSFE